MKNAKVSLVVLLLLNPCFAWADDNFDKGVSAFEKADYTDALRYLNPLAELGKARAQLFMGIMFAHGYGVKRDLKKAVGWYVKAAEQR
ncbi:MAG: hypothetical protein Q9N62_13390 [Ghiorsea sp.]|nr:hypothetical protein [Ghiorsea sp.]